MRCNRDIQNAQMRETGPRVQNRSTTEALSQGVNQLLMDCLYAGRVRQKRIIQFAADVGKMATAPFSGLDAESLPKVPFPGSLDPAGQCDFFCQQAIHGCHKAES